MNTEVQAISGHQAPQTSIQSLPPEILSAILAGCIQGTRITYDNNLPNVLAVCRQWRLLALQNPKCWSTVHIDTARPCSSEYGPRERLVISQADKWLDLVQNHPIDISLWHVHHSYNFQCTFLSELRQIIINDLSSNRLRIKMHWESGTETHLFGHLFKLTFLPPDSFIHLTHLRLNWFGGYYPAEIVVPQLKVLCYEYLGIDFRLTCPVLENLTVASTGQRYHSNSFDTLIDTIQLFPKLNKLVLDDMELRGIIDVDRLTSLTALQGVRTLGFGSMRRSTGVLQQLLSLIPDASTLILADPSSISEYIFSSYHSKFRELEVLEHPFRRLNWSRIPRKSTRGLDDADWGCHFFECFQELRSLRIGREFQEDNPYFPFEWPHLHNRSDVYYDPQALSAIIRTLGPRNGKGDSFYCPKLEEIHLTCIRINDDFLAHLMVCLRVRHGNADNISHSTLISTKGCTSDIGATRAFPDVTRLSYPEFSDVVVKHDGGSKPAMVWLETCNSRPPS